MSVSDKATITENLRRSIVELREYVESAGDLLDGPPYGKHYRFVGEDLCAELIHRLQVLANAYDQAEDAKVCSPALDRIAGYVMGLFQAKGFSWSDHPLTMALCPETVNVLKDAERLIRPQSVKTDVFPASAFPEAITRARLANAHKAGHILREWRKGRYQYSWSDAHECWPDLVDPEPPYRGDD